jgi:pyruvate kinase
MGRFAGKRPPLLGSMTEAGQGMARLFVAEGAVTLAGARTDLLRKVANSVRADGGTTIAATTGERGRRPCATTRTRGNLG